MTAAILPGLAEETKRCKETNNLTIVVSKVNYGNICHQYLPDTFN
jgi:hypothetical protein